MNKRIKKLWIKALRSGKYTQVKDTMKHGKGQNVSYCCLGVLEQIRCNLTGDRKFHDSGLLHPITIEWAELDTDDPVLAPNAGKQRQHASQLNDSGRDFNYIADRIEKYL